MLDRTKHQLIMGQILRDIYNNPVIAPTLGFKGGTCAYFFYDLPRFSVDLDFDLFDLQERDLVAGRVKKILEKYGKITDFAIKEKTILLELSYETDERRLKVEISIKSPIKNLRDDQYEIKEYLGISVLAAMKEYMFSCKLIALTSRNKFTMRDLYDVWFFAKNGWPISEEIIKVYTGKDMSDYLDECIKWIRIIKENQLLVGLGDLLDQKDKNWVKNNLRAEAISFLEVYKKNL